MGIFDFFKTKPQVLQIKTLQIRELESFILTEKANNKTKEEQCVKIIKNNLKLLTNEFEEEIKIINNIDLKERKIEDKIRLIVLDNAKTFANYLKRLKENLQDLNEEKLEPLIEHINKNLLEFKKRSHMSHEKANYLIGKELQAVASSIDSFYNTTNPLIKDNESLITNSKLLIKIDALFAEIQKTTLLDNQLKQELLVIEKDKSDLNKQEELSKKRLDLIANSKEHQEFLKKQQEFEKERNELKKDILNLKSLLKLKELAKIHHSSYKNMKIIHDYEENISEAFKKDNGQSILELITQNKEEITNEIEKILKKEQNLSSFNLEEDQLLKTQKEIQKTKDQIRILDNEKLKLEKRQAQLTKEIAELTASLTKELIAFNVKLE